MTSIRFVNFFLNFVFKLKFYFDFNQDEEDESIKELITERLHHLEPDLEEKEKVLKAYHFFFKLLASNISRHSKYLENVNRQNSVSAITPSNINKIIFGTFMKQPITWKNVNIIFRLSSDIYYDLKYFLGARN